VNGVGSRFEVRPRAGCLPRQLGDINLLSPDIIKALT
jgi:hypothetical protein